MSDAVSVIKKSLSSGSLIIGKSSVFKFFRKELVDSVFLSSNCPSSVVDDVNHYAEVFGSSVEVLDIPNVELGVVCRKPFAISMVAIVRSK